MIIVRLKGGFANQLFQYATARGLAEEKRTSVFFDLSYLNEQTNDAYTKRNFELDQIKVKASLASADDLKRFELNSLFKKVLNKLRFGKYLTIYESGNAPSQLFQQSKDNLLLDGYWQNELYFNKVRNELLQEIQPTYSFTAEGVELKRSILASNSVSVHVRRGDYVTLKNASDFHGLCSVEYYRQAIEELEKKYNGLSFFVFSDDIDWCKKELNFIKDGCFVEDEAEKRSSQDLFLMSLCKHNIIANSSYSWWSAWLNQNPEKTILAPKKWFKDSSIDTSGLIPNSWIKI